MLHPKKCIIYITYIINNSNYRKKNKFKFIAIIKPYIVNKYIRYQSLKIQFKRFFLNFTLSVVTKMYI